MRLPRPAWNPLRGSRASKRASVELHQGWLLLGIYDVPLGLLQTHGYGGGHEEGGETLILEDCQGNEQLDPLW